jgi:hypothetical protein
MSKRLADIFDDATPAQFWRLLGERLINMITDRVQNRHRNVDGQRMGPYNPDYAELKGRGFQNLTGGKRRFYKGKSISSRSQTPDLTVTGKTMADLQVRKVSKNDVRLGWAARGGIIESLHGTKNYQAVNLGPGEPFAKAEMRMIEKDIERAYDKELLQYAATPEVIRIGK